jgi:site-specific recombinase XerD
MSIREYLEKKHRPSTVKIYLFEIDHYLEHLGEQKAQAATYQEVSDYLGYLREKYDNAGTIHRILHAVKQYYYYLIEIDLRDTHPCRYMNIRDSKKEIQIQDLLSQNELDILLRPRKERYPLLKLRNQALMSLLIYQALLPGDIAKLTVEDIDLEKATIHIRGTRKTNERTLNLHASQVMIFYQYLNEVRPVLMKRAKPTAALMLTKRGSPEKTEGIHYLVSTYRDRLPNKKLSPRIIRQSVIASWLKQGKDLRVVQVFAGHKKPSATEKYRQTNLEALKQAVDKYHPLR